MGDWRIDGFTEIRELGRGAQGRVVLARHERSGTPVAIKYLGAGADRSAREAFRREARLLGRVDDPHVARLYRLVEKAEGMALVMEAVNGVSLQRILQEYQRLEPEAALAVLSGSLHGLAAAHAVGVVHRDYKPANVVVPADGNSKLVDFGVAALAGEGTRGGTPLYMAPEQWRGGPASPATDVYAATCVFYECVTGRRPFSAGSSAELAALHLNAPVPVADLPEPLRPLVERGMAKDPADRPAGAAAFAAELQEAARAAYGDDWLERGVRRLAGAAAGLAALFPLAALALPSGAAGAAGTAGAAVGAAGGAGAAGSVSAGASAAGQGLLAAVGTKAAAGAVAAVVAGGVVTGAAIYAGTSERRADAPARLQVTVTTAALNRTLSLSEGRLELRNGQYPQISGHRDAQTQRRVNELLRAPVEDQLAFMREAIESNMRNTPGCNSRNSQLTSRFSFGVRGPALLSGRYRFEHRTDCYQGGELAVTVTVDLRTGRRLQPADILRPEILNTPAGQRRINQRIDRYWRNRDPLNPPLPITFSPYRPPKFGVPEQSVDDGGQLTLGVGHLEIVWGWTSGGSTIAGPVRIPYHDAADLLRPEILAAVTGSSASPSPS